MQLSSLFALLPLLALVSAAEIAEPAQVMESGKHHERAYGESSYGKDNDDGEYHDEPKNELDGDEADENAYKKRPEHRVESKALAAVPKQTVVIVVAKSQTTQRTVLTAGRPSQQPEVRYVSPGGRAVTPAASPYMLAINKTFALRINPKENDHIKKNRVYPNRTKCLTVRRHGIHNRFKARLEKCSDDQRFWLRSPLSFRFEPAGNDQVHLTWMDPKGVKRCARHDTAGTRFYPCAELAKNAKDSDKATRYVILPTDYSGKFKIKQANRNRCFDGAHRNLWMNRCRGFDDQAWDVVTIAYDQL